MLIDLEELTAPLPTQKSAICIAGAGVAGLVLATALADGGRDVHLLEAGGRGDEDRSQEIYGADMAGRTHTGTSVGRFRVFGGSSTRWGGQLLPFTHDIFSPPGTLSAVGWPLSAVNLEPFYSQIQGILGANDLPFDIDLLKRLGKSFPGAFDSHPHINLRFSKWAPFSYRNLAKTLGVKAIASERITVFLHANVTECLLSNDGSSLEAFLVRNYKGECFNFQAHQYVISTGTIETSRLLLASRSICATGVGNDHDQVGRRFHDHLSVPVATVNGATRNELLAWMGPFFVGQTTHTARMEASVALRQQLDLPAIMAHLEIEEPGDSGIFVARQLLRSFQRGEMLSGLAAHYKQLPRASVDITRLLYNVKFRKRRTISPKAKVLIRVSCEQHPRLENRIRLADGTQDSLGIPRTIVDWRVYPDEILSMRRYAQWLHDEMKRLEIGSIDWDPDALTTDHERFPKVRDTNHPMGGTVMGANPADSVVDTDLRVHGLKNFYVASCSTYPSGGSSNPTFTLMALSLRLADRLRHLSRN